MRHKLAFAHSLRQNLHHLRDAGAGQGNKKAGLKMQTGSMDFAFGIYLFFFFQLLLFIIFACAAAKRAIGTR